MSGNKIFSYTKRDYEGSRQEGISQIPTLSRGNWTDLNATDPGIILLDYVHALVDMVNFYQDHQALESFLVTARERVNIFRLAKQLSYKIRSAKGATCVVTFDSSPLSFKSPVRIPKGTILYSSSEIPYYTVKDAYLKSGDMTVDVLCSQGSVSTMEYRGTGLSKYSTDKISPSDQFIHIPESTVDIDTISIVDNTGHIWKKVDYLSFAEEGERVYQIDLVPDNTVLIKFGDGERGFVPRVGDIFTITYIVTEAENGRVPANDIVSLGSLIELNGNYVEFEVTNKKPSVGGSSAQSTQSIKELAPGVIKAQDRAVTISDFEYLARTVDGVGDAKASDINTNSSLMHHEVELLILPEVLDSNTEILKKRVYDFIYQRMIPPTRLSVVTPSYVPIDLDIVVSTYSRELSGATEFRIKELISTYFNDNLQIIGESFNPYSLSSILYSIDEIKEIVSIDVVSEQPEDSIYNIPVIGNIQISHA